MRICLVIMSLFYGASSFAQCKIMLDGNRAESMEILLKYYLSESTALREWHEPVDYGLRTNRVDDVVVGQDHFGNPVVHRRLVAQVYRNGEILKEVEATAIGSDVIFQLGKKIAEYFASIGCN